MADYAEPVIGRRFAPARWLIRPTLFIRSTSLRSLPPQTILHLFGQVLKLRRQYVTGWLTRFAQHRHFDKYIVPFPGNRATDNSRMSRMSNRRERPGGQGCAVFNHRPACLD